MIARFQEEKPFSTGRERGLTNTPHLRLLSPFRRELLGPLRTLLHLLDLPRPLLELGHLPGPLGALCRQGGPLALRRRWLLLLLPSCRRRTGRKPLTLALCWS